MFNFFKKFFGFDKETMKEANVQIEQLAPYKIEPPLTTVKEEVTVTEQIPAVITTNKKPRTTNRVQGTTPVAKRGRKPATK